MLIVGLLALPLLAGTFVSTGWSWGWDYLHRVPILWPCALLALTMVFCVPPLARCFLSFWDQLGSRFGRTRLAGPLVLALLSVAVFAAFPIATRIYGDSHTILRRHAAADLSVHLKELVSLGILTRGSAVFLLHDLLERLTGLTYERCYMVLSILCGGIFVFAHLRLAASLQGVVGWGRLAIAWIGLTDGANQLFFSHIENYAVPRLFACLFLIALTRSILMPDSRPRRIVLFLPLILAIFFHLQ
jgi:hypothetical protein